MDVRQITLGLSSDRTITEFIEWCTECTERVKCETGQTWLSFDVEDFIVDKDDLKEYECRLKQFRDGEDVEDVHTVRVGIKDSNIEHVPVSIIYGDGLTWLAICKLPFEGVYKEGREVMIDGYAAVDLMMVHLSNDHPVFKFFRSFSAIVGCNITKDAENLTSFLLDFYDVTLILPRQVELAALFVSAGGSFERTALEVLSFLLLGGLQNKHCSTGDNTWYKNLVRLSHPLKSYILADVRAGHVLGVVLFTCIIRQNFADPDAPAFCLSMDQRRLVIHLNDVLIYGLNGSKIFRPQKIPLCKDRSESIDNLRPEMFADKDQPKKLRIMQNLLSSPFPTILFGGARIAHQVREFFVWRQYGLLKELNTPASVDINYNLMELSNDLHEQAFNYLLLGRTLSQHQALALPPCDDPGLLPSPLYYNRVRRFIDNVKADQSILYSDRLSDCSKENGNMQSVAQMLIEAVCIDPGVLTTIIGWLSGQDLDSRLMWFWRDKALLYERLRYLYFNVRGIMPIDAKNMRSILRGKVCTIIRQELTSHSDAEREARLLMGLQLMIESNSNEFATLNLQGNLYSTVPGKNKSRNYHYKKDLKRLKDDGHGRSQRAFVSVQRRLGGQAYGRGFHRDARARIEEIRRPGSSLKIYFF